MHFKLDLCPKPYVRMTQRGKWVKKDALEYLASQRLIKAGLWQAMIEESWTMIPGGRPLAVEVDLVHNHGLHGHDLDNAGKAVVDAAQGVVYENDRWIDRLSVVRERGDECGFVLRVRGL